MEEFYRNWFRLQQNENPEYQFETDNRNESGNNDRDRNESGNNQDTNQDTVDGHENDAVDGHENDANDPSNIVYETPELQLIVEKGIHRRQKRFKIEDQMFYLKLVPKNQTEMPLLLNVLDFLYHGIVFILNEMKKHIQSGEEHTAAYLTLFQRPMLNGLNTGTNILKHLLFVLITIIPDS